MNLSDLLVERTHKKQLRDEFEGVALNPALWTSSVGSGMSLTVSGSVMTLAAGTTANAVSTVTSLQSFKAPVKAQALIQISQRVINQDLYFELIDVTGTIFARWHFNGTVVTNALGETSSLTSNVGSAITINSTTASVIAEISIDTDRVMFVDRLVDSTASGSIRRLVTNRIPSVDTPLFLRIRVVNGATPPAGNTLFIVDFIAADEHERLDVSVQDANGLVSGGASCSMPTTVQNTVTVDSELAAAAALADGVANPTTAMVGAGNMLFNGATWDRQRGNYNLGTGDSGAKASGIFTGTTQINYNGRGAMIQLDIGAASALNVKVQAQLDGGSGLWYDIPGASFPVINAAGIFTLVIYPGLTAVANSVVPFVLPRNVRLYYSSSGFTLNNVWFAYIL